MNLNSSVKEWEIGALGMLGAEASRSVYCVLCRLVAMQHEMREE
jgi:hypothetical protein